MTKLEIKLIESLSDALWYLFISDENNKTMVDFWNNYLESYDNKEKIEIIEYLKNKNQYEF